MVEMNRFLNFFWQRMLRDLGLQRTSPRLYYCDETLLQSVQDLAAREQRPEEEVTNDLLSYALKQRETAEGYLCIWQALSPREQQVAALTCLRYTNRQIARRLMISPETVKSHVRNVLRKFNLHSKVELARVLDDWDFSEWHRI